MAYLRNKLAEWMPAAVAAIVFVAAMTPATDAIPVTTWTYEGICRELIKGSTEGRQALVGSLWHAPLPTLVGLPAAALLARGTAMPRVASVTVVLALGFIFYVLLRFCRRLFPPRLAGGCWLACILVLARLPLLTLDPRLTVTLAAALAALVKLADWCGGRRLADLVKFALSLALLALCGASLAGWTLLLALLLLAIAALDPAARPRFQGIAILGLLPVLYALGIWALMSRLILLDAVYPCRFLLHGLLRGPGWQSPAIPPDHLGALACCALLGVTAAFHQARRTALLGLAGVALLVWHLLLQAFGLAWAAGAASATLTLTSLLTLASALHDLTRIRSASARSVAMVCTVLLFLAFCLPPSQTFIPQATQNRRMQSETLDAIERFIRSRTPHGRVFICGYRGLGLLEGQQRDLFVPCLDLHIGALRERYPRQNLFLLVPRPEADAALECAVWRHGDIYAHGTARALFAGDWGDWRLYEMITAPSADELKEWRQLEP